MRTNAATAQKAQDVTPTMTILEPTATEKTAKVIQFKASAQEAKSEPITQEATAETTAQQTIALETEEAETVSIYDVIAKVNAEYISGERILPSEAARKAAEETAAATATAPTAAEEVTPTIIESAPAPIIEAKPVQSIEDIKRKSEVLSRLAVKWDTLAEKRRRVENFAISHDGDTASAIIRDAQGEVFESNSPKTIGKLIEFWKAEFSEAIANVEKEMREIA